MNHSSCFMKDRNIRRKLWKTSIGVGTDMEHVLARETLDLKHDSFVVESLDRETPLFDLWFTTLISSGEINTDREANSQA